MRTPFYYLDQFSRFPARRKRKKSEMCGKSDSLSTSRPTYAFVTYRFLHVSMCMYILHVHVSPRQQTPNAPCTSVDIRDVSKSLLVTIFGRANRRFFFAKNDFIQRVILFVSVLT
jgi:hypothetical protein